MRKLSESFATPRKPIFKQGVMNHYTPIDNIIINTRNIFGALLGLVITKGEDGMSLKIQSHNFTNPEVTRNILYNSSFDGYTYLYSYIQNQGLQGFKILDLGTQCIAYFFPVDVAGCDACCKEMTEARIYECEMIAENQEVELEDHTKEELAEIINNPNKVKGANDFANRIQEVVTLPEDMYIKATKDIDGHESISLRYKTVKRRPFGGKMDCVTSLMNIYSTGPNAIWVDAFLNKDLYSEEIIDIIDNILQFIGAEKTQDDAVWNIPDANCRPANLEEPNQDDIENAQQELQQSDIDGEDGGEDDNENSFGVA